MTTRLDTPDAAPTAEPTATGAAAEAGIAAASPAALEPAVADGVLRSLDPRNVTLQRIVGWIVAAVVSPALFVGLSALVWAQGLPLWAGGALALAWLLVTLGLLWLAQRWPAIEHRHTSYRVDAQGLEIRRGVLWRHVLSVPRSRVQHTDVSQGPLQRSHGLGTLVIHTAGTDHARVELAGLDRAVALRMRDHLLPREGDDAV